jgi:hypothetical protein
MLEFLTASLLTLLPAPPTAPAAPKGSPPQLQYVTVTDRGELQFIELRYITVEVQVQVVVNGIAQVRKELQMVPVMMTKIIDKKSLTVTTAGGKEVPKDDLPKLLKDGAVVVWSGDGKPVDPAYLKPFKEETLVFVVTPPAPVLNKELPKRSNDK